jgi:large-conductance mechanosensitive channel
MKTCSQCGQEYSDDKKFCLRCGISLEKGGVNEGLTCAQCGTTNNADFKFCKKCGNKLRKEVVKPVIPEVQPAIVREQTKEESLKKEDIVFTPKEKTINVSTVEKEEKIIARKEEPKVEPQIVQTRPKEDIKVVTEIKKPVRDADAKQEEKTFEKPIKKPAPVNVATEKATITPGDSQKKSYAKFVVIVVIAVILAVAIFFVKSYLSNAKKEVTQEAQPQKPVDLSASKPLEETQSKSSQQAATAPDKSNEQGTLIIPKQQQVPVPEKPVEQESPKQEKKSFAPHSRDNL